MVAFKGLTRHRGLHMNRVLGLAFLLVGLLCGQAPTGEITGTVTTRPGRW